MAPAQWQTQSAGATLRSLGSVKIEDKETVSIWFLMLTIVCKNKVKQDIFENGLLKKKICYLYSFIIIINTSSLKAIMWHFITNN